ncbi:Metal-dependent hydrolase, endonuclease/exonuclease/phosphatase family [Jatrophihabitans endophyticus]|uniref:Metal-dependent hydrolase, endonuclease/exonuclease/phosphatase family n=1 Tax=Jatrophihabitans endophyticus TaxID=1206085 RepID=A0A1M5KPP2_9ACTN|nr:endonuclease/exonuclease/phosphatase family protein [Jatrophihabitans endophyticus]SHG54489.1 Metal-dependent hydrolase, endonuclease/exonuclease/phosphatase family [Jatrophihabitans endophyticus]
MTALRIASFNVRTSTGMDGRNHWLLRRAACVAAIRGLAPDVLGVQEARPGQLADLRRAFPDWTVAGRGRDANGGGEHAAVLVSPGRWQLESSDTRWLSPTPDRPGSRGWGAEHPRVVTLARLRHDDVRVGVANTHFDHSSHVAREHSAALVAQWLADEDDRYWVVVGDLNVGPDDPPVRALLAAGWTDALAGVSGGTEHAFTGAIDRVRIDHVLVARGVGVTDARIDHTRPGGRLPSDHWPVVADLEIPA